MNPANTLREGTWRAISTLVTVLLILTASTLSAQTDWSAALGIRPGARVRVVTQSRERVTGHLVAVTSDLLVVDVAGHERRLLPSEVRRLYTIHGVKRSAVKGLLIAGAAGVSMALATAETNRGSWAAMLGAGWAAIGAVIGSVTGLLDRERLVYSSAGP